MRHTGEKLWRWRWFRLRDWERFKVQGGGLEKSWWESRAPSPPSAFLFLLRIWLMSRALQCMARLHRGLTGPQVRTLGRPKWKGKKIEKTWDGGLAVFFFACHRPAICLSALQRWYHCFFFVLPDTCISLTLMMMMMRLKMRACTFSEKTRVLCQCQ